MIADNQTMRQLMGSFFISFFVVVVCLGGFFWVLMGGPILNISSLLERLEEVA